MLPLLVLTLMVATVFAMALGLAAAALDMHGRHARKARVRRSLEARWQPLLLRTLDAGDPSVLTAHVAASERLFFLEYLFRYASRLQGREREILAETAAPFLPALMARLRGRADPEQRARAVRTVGLLGGTEHVEDLLFALEDPSPLVAMSAARALALRGHPRLVELFLDRAERFQDWSPRFFASMLASAGTAALDPLREVVADEARRPWTRRVAMDALAEMNDVHAAPLATAVLDASDDRDLQCACLRLIERLGSAAQAPAARRLVDSSSPMVRLCAISAIGALGNEDDLPALRAALEEPDMWLVLNVARALRSLGDEGFLAELARTEDARARVAAQVLREARA
ncbi:MAG TPA: HEAT repeat domain-containing protein [Longimicrobiaceae bacterium]|nr:HEAT repeat domain-containing protein [Longimicrobiaceae bacterium]